MLVIWALGWSMIFLAGLIYLPIWAITVFALIVIGGHNLLDPVRPESFGPLAWTRKLLHAPDVIVLSREYLLVAIYPLVPWVGVMAAGYVFGAWFKVERRERRKRLLWLGIGITAAFIVVRAVNIYDDPIPMNGATQPPPHLPVVHQLWEIPAFLALSSHDSRAGDYSARAARP